MRPLVLCVLDGWGVAPLSHSNAIGLAKTLTMDELVSHYPSATLEASGEAVGLPYGEMGNSEVGHLTMGIGTVHFQNFVRINKAILDRTFFEHPILRALCERVVSRGRALHLIGMVSTGAVHSDLHHLYALLEAARNHNVAEVYVHAILDGRDAPYNSGANFLQRLEERLALFASGRIATIAGRHWAMDRDQHWERTQAAYRAIVLGDSRQQFRSVSWAMRTFYNQGTYDEMISPTVILDRGGTHHPVIRQDDGVMLFNFRPDRMRQLAQALADPSFQGFERNHPVLAMTTMTVIDERLPVQTLFPPAPIQTCLTQLISEAGFRQAHIAETEKYAHVTYFFNGLREEPFSKEERILVPSPRVVSYDLEPQMSAWALCDRTLELWKTKQPPAFTIINFANADMVAHTGNVEATVQAIEIIDQCLARLVREMLPTSTTIVITADHGNAEEMIDETTGLKNTSHSRNPVPLIIIDAQYMGQGTPVALAARKPIGGLVDVAPTILELMGFQKPESMTGTSLLPMMIHRGYDSRRTP